MSSGTGRTLDSFSCKVIVDVDAGADDAMALLMLITAEARLNIEVLAITCVQGNTSVDNVCTNVLRLLQSVGRLDIPVYRGAEHPLIPPDKAHESDLHHFHGQDGFGDVIFADKPDSKLIQKKSAVSALNQITSQAINKGKVSLICLGPLTNIALATRTYNDFLRNVKDVIIMGGNSSGIGNVTSSAEFNFFNDPEAAQIVLSSTPSTITLIPWETCLEIPLSMEWRFDVLGAIENKHMQLINTVERKVCERMNCTTFYTCDPLVTAVFLCPDIVTKSKHVHMTVELHGHRTRGQSVIDHLNTNKPNVRLIEKLDIELFKEMMLWTAGH